MELLSDKALCLWGKKSRLENSNESNDKMWLPLYIHMTDTAEVMELLWKEWIRNPIKKEICKSFEYELTEKEILCLLRFLGAVHDLGKATPVFQAKVISNHPTHADKIILQRMRELDIPLSSDNYFQVKHAEAGYTILREKGNGDIKNISSIIGSHHGVPTDKGAKSRDVLSESYFCGNQGKECWDNIQTEYLQFALYCAGLSELKDLPKVSMKAQVWLSGLLIMADWISSNETYFPPIYVDDLYTESSKERLGKCYDKLGFLKKGWRLEGEMIPDPYAFFKKCFGFHPNELQRNVVNTVTQMSDPGMIVIEAEMGGGKTEAALAACDIFARKFGCSGIFFALPSQATSDGMFGRVQKFAATYKMPASIQLMHGKAAYNEEYNQLSASCIEADNPEGFIQIEEWFSGRKQAVLADFVVGTVDQVLMAALQQKHVMLRHLGLANKVVIIDEVHAYDAYMNQYLKRVLEWLGSYHTPVILLSATLPYQKKKELVGAYNNYTGESFPEYNNQLPRITYSCDTVIGQRSVEEKTAKKTIYIKKIEEENIISLIKEALREKCCIGVVVNTISRAQNMYSLICREFKDIEVDLLHSGFLVKDRLDCEKKIRAKLGKPSNSAAKRPDQYIVIGTQVLEQSLDIDFDWMITDIAPIDLLLQRMGRLHRHKRDRALTFQQPVCSVITSSEGVNSSKKIYGEYLVDRTIKILPNKMILPDDISDLIGEVYNDLETDQEWVEWKRNEELKKEKSERFLIKSPAPVNHQYRYTMPDLMKTDLALLNEGENGEARVRDTNGSIEVVLMQKRNDEYLMITTGKEIDFSEPSCLKELSAETVNLPFIVSNPGMFSGTLKALDEEQEAVPDSVKKSPWLRGKKVLILDQDLHTRLSINGKNYWLIYDDSFGIMIGKE